MGTYLGCVEYKIPFYNFKPLVEVKNSRIEELTSEERQYLLPESSYNNVNLYYNSRDEDQVEFMRKHFENNCLVICDFCTEDLQINEDRNGVRNEKTGYKINAIDQFKLHKIRYPEDDNIFLVVSNSEYTEKEFLTVTQTSINADSLKPNARCDDNAKIFCELSSGLYAGPYKLGFRETFEDYYFRPQLKDNGYMACGFKKEDCYVVEPVLSDYWTPDAPSWTILMPKKNAVKVYEDKITNTQLLESLRDSLPDDDQKSGYINIGNVDKLVDTFSKSCLLDTSIPSKIRENRIDRLYDFLTSSKEIDDVQSLLANGLEGLFSKLLIKNSDSEKANQLIDAILNTNPDLLDKVRDCRVLKEKRNLLEAEVNQLQQEKDDEELKLSKIKAKIEDKDLNNLVNEQNQTDIAYAKYSEKEQEIKKLEERLNILTNLDDIQKQVKIQKEQKSQLEHDLNDIETHKRYLEEGTQHLETSFVETINNYHDKMVNIAFDGYMSNRMLRAAANWEQGNEQQKYVEAVELINQVEGKDLTPEEVVDYICDTIKIARPQYENNDIINIVICICQGLLTVFSGEPGCGKTSICNLVGRVLGLNNIPKKVQSTDDSINISRYIPVSVERGWTSKRDLIGYYNPLSKAFDKSNKLIYDGLKILDLETKKQYEKYPLIILLDEANLSPMEYYWADFMNICDDLDANSHINLGDNYSFRVPETLHFVATINNDHTTEVLSPRLIDRSWIITLPRFTTLKLGNEISEDKIHNVTWASLKQAFIPNNTSLVMPSDIEQLYNNITSHVYKYIPLSPRIKIAIERYYAIGSVRFSQDKDGVSPQKIALDYAIAQKVLPKICGNGKEYRKWLEEFKQICSQNDLNKSSEIIKTLILRGDEQMDYYNFFYNN